MSKYFPFIQGADTATMLKQEEQFLAEVEQGVLPAQLWFWESKNLTVVCGKGNKPHQEVWLDHCQKSSIAVLKRCSGGGTVLQGPGCLNYSFILPLTHLTRLYSIKQSINTMMTHLCQALQRLEPTVTIAGISDLCWQQRKISGNAQRRLKNSMLYHGTVLYNMNLSHITTYLKHPSREPHYRQQRHHQDFVINFPHPAESIVEAISDYWQSLTYCHKNTKFV